MIFLLSLCVSALTKKEYLLMAERIAKEEKVPVNLFKAIVNKESSWNPYAVYGGKRSYHFDSKKDALIKVAALRRAGRRNINIGMTQVNIQHHKKPSVDQLFDAEFNLKYGAKYLRRLHNQFGSWRAAVGYFHAGSNAKFYGTYTYALRHVLPD